MEIGVRVIVIAVMQKFGEKVFKLADLWLF